MNLLAALFCVALFSLTVPFTRIATLELSPLLVVSLRLSGAGLVCAALIGVELWIPPRRIWPLLLLTSLGAVLGFSLLTAFALQEVPSVHGALGLAALPAVTAGYSSLRDRVNPGPVFWFFALLGTLLSVSYFFAGGVGALLRGDLLLVLAVLSASLGYVEGGRLSREFGGKRIMSWAVLLVLPLSLLLSIFLLQQEAVVQVSASVWVSILYLALVSQSLGMMLWYRVLAVGPMEKVALVQLLQPFFTLLVALWFLHEEVAPLTWVLAALVLLCIAGAFRSRAAAGPVAAR